MKTLALAAVLAATAGMASAAAEKYVLDSSHSQVLFSYDHLGYSTTFGMFSGFEGEIMFDQDNPAASTVTVSMPTKSMFTGWEAREGHFMSDDFFGATDEDENSYYVPTSHERISFAASRSKKSNRVQRSANRHT